MVPEKGHQDRLENRPGHLAMQPHRVVPDIVENLARLARYRARRDLRHGHSVIGAVEREPEQLPPAEIAEHLGPVAGDRQAARIGGDGDPVL
jgi:hypothetical protein